ncbi:MAG: FAD-dependent oxidoreductase [Sulfolobales archaeon]
MESGVAVILFDVGILGCGWAGVVTSYLISLKYPGSSIVCIDKEESLGGLLRSSFSKGFYFDVGGSHIIFSNNSSILSKLLSFLESNLISHERKTFIIFDGNLIPYPFENSLHVLPSTMRGEILISFVEGLLERIRQPNWEPHNFREWMYGFFGKEMSKLYLEPYNYKLWKRPLDEIDVDWVYTPGRLPIPDWRDVIRSGVGIKTEGYKEQARFYYPLRGGIQSLFDGVMSLATSRGVKVVKGLKITKVKKTTDGWLINDSINVRRLISTIPLNELIEALDLSEYEQRLAKQLDYNSVAVVGLALKRKAPPMHWIYNTRNDVIFHRHIWMSNYSPYNTPNNEEYSSLVTEMTFPPSNKILNNEVVDEVLLGLTKLGVLENPDKEVMFSKLWIHTYGYPVHSIKSNKARGELLRILNEFGVIAVGRWGSWKYLNMDKVYEQAMNAVGMW